jgi:hypothetical protein
MTYTLTRYDDATETETEYEIEFDVGYEPANYEDGYYESGDYYYKDGGATCDGKPFDLTADEDKEINSWLNDHRTRRNIADSYIDVPDRDIDPPDFMD